MGLFRSKDKDDKKSSIFSTPKKESDSIFSPPIEREEKSPFIKNNISTHKPTFSKPDTPIEEPTVTVLGKNISFDGNLKGSGSVKIDGLFKGTISIKKELKVSKNGNVEAKVDAEVVVIEGKLKGDINASKKVIITSNGHVLGNIKAKSIEIQEGAIFKGKIEMDTKPKIPKPDLSSKKIENTPKKPPFIKTIKDEQQQTKSTFPKINLPDNLK